MWWQRQPRGNAQKGTDRIGAALGKQLFGEQISDPVGRDCRLKRGDGAGVIGAGHGLICGGQGGQPPGCDQPPAMRDAGGFMGRRLQLLHRDGHADLRPEPVNRIAQDEQEPGLPQICHFIEHRAVQQRIGGGDVADDRLILTPGQQILQIGRMPRRPPGRSAVDRQLRGQLIDGLQHRTVGRTQFRP